MGKIAIAGLLRAYWPEASPFSRYGWLEGRVEDISPGAIGDDKRGLVFPARIRLVGSRLKRVANLPLVAL